MHALPDEAVPAPPSDPSPGGTGDADRPRTADRRFTTTDRRFTTTTRRFATAHWFTTARRFTAARTIRPFGPRRPSAALLGVAALLALPAAAHGMGLPRPVLPAGPTVGASLTVTYGDGSGSPQTYVLICGPDVPGAPDATAGPDTTDPAATAGTTAVPDTTGAAGTALGRAEQDGCRHLQEIGGPVPAVPEGQMCSMIYGGPQTAEVRGTWDGRTVTESYRRTNGCEVARWSRMVPALPNPESPTAPPPAENTAENTTQHTNEGTDQNTGQHADQNTGRPPTHSAVLNTAPSDTPPSDGTVRSAPKPPPPRSTPAEPGGHLPASLA